MLILWNILGLSYIGYENVLNDIKMNKIKFTKKYGFFKFKKNSSKKKTNL